MIGAVIAAAPQIIGGVGALLGGNSKDGERLAANQTAYGKAVAGDPNALAFLKQRSGRYGTVTINGYGSVGGWATQVAKDDAWAKFQMLGTQAQVQSAIDSGTSALGTAAQTLAQETGNTIVPGTKQQLSFAVVAVLILVAFAAMSYAKRKA